MAPISPAMVSVDEQDLRNTAFCGIWKSEYSSPYNPYSNQHKSETYTLLSCGAAFHSSSENYDEGSDYFSSQEASGWGHWKLETDGRLIVQCRLESAVVSGIPARGMEPRVLFTNEHVTSDCVLEISGADFLRRFKRSSILDKDKEEMLRCTMRVALDHVESKKVLRGRPMRDEKRRKMEHVSESFMENLDSEASRSLAAAVRWEPSEEEQVENLLKRFPSDSESEIRKALSATGFHGGRAASILGKNRKESFLEKMLKSMTSIVG